MQAGKLTNGEKARIVGGPRGGDIVTIISFDNIHGLVRVLDGFGRENIVPLEDLAPYPPEKRN